jgi:hypothetical protein
VAGMEMTRLAVPTKWLSLRCSATWAGSRSAAQSKKRIGPSDLCNTGSSMHRGCLEREDWCVGTPESAATLDLVFCVQCSVWVDECVHGFAPNVEADSDHLTPFANVRVWILLLDERLVFGDPGTDKMSTN